MTEDEFGKVEEALWYGIAFVSYVVLAIWHKWLLNWFVGPLWLVATVWVGPLVVRRLPWRRRAHAARVGQAARR